MGEMTHETCSTLLDAFQAKVKASEDLAAHCAMEYARTDSIVAKNNYTTHMRDAHIWREASKLFSTVRAS